MNEYWRYRIGKYRIITRIDDDKIIINIISVGHRSNIYKKNI
nr:type II toxin-antitoxin system RelE/ParE family toxin [Nosocomiicoccus ampullae]